MRGKGEDALMGVHWIPFPLDFTFFKFETLVFRVGTSSSDA